METELEPLEKEIDWFSGSMQNLWCTVHSSLQSQMKVEWKMLYRTFQATSFKITGNIIETFPGSVSAKSFGPTCA